jgi:hypothetical protein
MSDSNSKQQSGQMGAGLLNGVTDSFRDLMGIQFRATQVMMDKTLGLGQTWTDFLQTQMHEGMKLQQECMRYGWTLTENLKKSTFEVTDRAFRSNAA